MPAGWWKWPRPKTSSPSRSTLYTEALIGTIPLPDPRLRKAACARLGGEIASLTNPPPGCNFHPRCRYATAACKLERPPLRTVNDRQVACHHAEALTLKGA